MIDLMQAVSDAAWQALDDCAALTALAPTFQHVPQDTPPPMSLLGNLASEDVGGKGEQAERISFEVIAVYRGAQRSVLLDIMHQQRLAIEAGLALAGIDFGPVTRLAAETDGPGADGATYAGIQTFTVDAEPA